MHVINSTFWHAGVRRCLPEFFSCNYGLVPWEKDLPAQVFHDVNARLRALHHLDPHDAAVASLRQGVVRCAVEAIYFSNRIEGVGVPLADTDLLCRHILAAALYPQDEHGAITKQTSTAVGKPGQPVAACSALPSDAADASSSSTACREVTQHAEAYCYLQRMLVVQREALTAAVLNEGHRILMRGMLREDGVAVHAGQYRTTAAHAGPHAFDPPAVIQRNTDSLLELFEEREAEAGADPCALAAWLSFAFVAIHPYDDGNGRMSRLLMNVVLLRGGVPFPVALGFSSRHKKASQHYMGCIRHAQRAEHGQTSTARLAFVVLCAVRACADALLKDVSTTAPPSVDASVEPP